MTAHTHTPGPWKVTAAGFDEGTELDEATYVIAASGGMELSLANALLIAAAPELLEALEPFAAVAEYAAFLSAADSDYIDVAPFTAGQYRAAAAAVAKVRGAA